MKCLVPTLLLLCVCATSVLAQDPFHGALPPLQSQPARDAWEAQDPRYDTPKQAVRRKAAWKAAQRRQRLENMKRVGYSPSRPPTSPLPFMGTSYRPWIVVTPYAPLRVTLDPRGAAAVPADMR